MIAATLTAEDGRNRRWDVIVVGAGPAGSVAAIGLARQGLSVLLADRSEFPRHKLCGACLNGSSIAGLAELGLADALDRLGGIELKQFHMQSSGKSMLLKLPTGLAVTRRQLDAMLVEAAIEAGADFLPGLSLNVDAAEADCSFRQLSTSDRNSRPFEARIVVMATGLGADRKTSDPELSIVAKPGARIGAGTTTDIFPSYYTPGTIFMAVGQSGYVGLTRTEGQSLNIAAALDRNAVRETSPQAVCEDILNRAGFPVISEMLSGDWLGTIGLTRHRRTLASRRLFVIGDAAGYVEPFTGEGMAWAIRGGQAVSPFVVQALANWNSSLIRKWSKTSSRLIGRRQRWCRLLVQVLRYPTAVRGLIRVVSSVPALGQVVISKLNQKDHNELLNSRTRYGNPS